MNIASMYDDGTYEEQSADWHESDAAWKATQVACMLEAVGVRPKTLCDIGCGTGGVLEALRPLLPETALTGYELSRAALTLAPPARKEVVEFVTTPISQDRRTFDVALCLDVFEHVSDYYGFLQEVRAKADQVVFHIPIEHTLQTLVRPQGLKERRLRLGHIHHFSHASALDLLESTGFSVIRARRTTPDFDRPPTTLRGWTHVGPKWLTWKLSPTVASQVFLNLPLLVFATSSS